MISARRSGFAHRTIIASLSWLTPDGSRATRTKLVTGRLLVPYPLAEPLERLAVVHAAVNDLKAQGFVAGLR